MRNHPFDPPDELESDPGRQAASAGVEALTYRPEAGANGAVDDTQPGLATAGGSNVLRLWALMAGQKLAADPNYPDPEVIRNVATRIADSFDLDALN